MCLLKMLFPKLSQVASMCVGQIINAFTFQEQLVL